MKFTIENQKKRNVVQDMKPGDFAIIDDPEVIDQFKNKLITIIEDVNSDSHVVFLENGISEEIQNLLDVYVTILKNTKITIEV